MKDVTRLAFLMPISAWMSKVYDGRELKDVDLKQVLEK